MPEHINENDEQQQNQNVNDTTNDNEGQQFDSINLDYGALSINADPNFSNLKGNINMFGSSSRIAPGILNMETQGESYSMDYQGALPLNGNTNGFAMTNARTENISISDGELNEFSLQADQLTFGRSLTLNKISARKQGDGSFEVEAKGAKTLDILGHQVDLSNSNPNIKIGADGTLQAFEVFNVSSGGVSAGTITMDSAGNSFTIGEGNVDSPETLGEILTVGFTTLNMNSSGTSGKGGTIDKDAKIQLLNDTMQLENLNGNVDVNNDNWIVDVLGEVDYSNNENLQVAGGGQFASNSATGSSTTTLQDSNLNANINGIAITASGIEYDTTEDVIKMATGQASVPTLSDGHLVNATISNAEYSDTKGFGFGGVELDNAAADSELLSGLEMNNPNVSALLNEG